MRRKTMPDIEPVTDDHGSCQRTCNPWVPRRGPEFGHSEGGG